MLIFSYQEFFSLHVICGFAISPFSFVFMVNKPKTEYSMFNGYLTHDHLYTRETKEERTKTKLLMENISQHPGHKCKAFPHDGNQSQREGPWSWTSSTDLNPKNFKKVPSGVEIWWNWAQKTSEKQCMCAHYTPVNCWAATLLDQLKISNHFQKLPHLTAN